MILIADSGSTKATWCLIEKNATVRYFETEGYNPYFRTATSIKESMIMEMPHDFDKEAITELYFYGAGCFPEKESIIKEAFGEIFKKAVIFVYLDLLGAARSLLGDGSGIVAILGTGSNSCMYKEGRIIRNIDSLGYLLGDEGSGCDIGKKLIGDYIRGYMPLDIQESFIEQYTFSPSALMEYVYNQPLVNRYCASFSLFAGKHMGHPYIDSLIKTSFDNFFRNLVCKYDDYLEAGFNCVGSVAFTFSLQLKISCNNAGMNFEKLIKAPIDGLVEYHHK